METSVPLSLDLLAIKAISNRELYLILTNDRGEHMFLIQDLIEICTWSCNRIDQDWTRK